MEALVRLADWGVFEGYIWRAYTEAWNDLYGRHLLDGVGVLALVIPLACGLFVLLSALVHVVDLHRSGSVLHSFALAARVASASLWTALFLLAGLLAAIATIGLTTKGLTRPLEWDDGLLPLVPACVLLLAAWTSGAVDGAGDSCAGIVIPPMCEGCGYDLTHRPATGQCPECGLAIGASLDQSVRRSGRAWEANGGAISWLATTGAIIGKPRSFYGRLKLRTPCTRRFLIYQLLIISVGAGVWIGTTMSIFSNRIQASAQERVLVPIIAALVAPLCGWVIHRLLAAVVFMDWLRRRTLPDFSWARKVLYYESAFLWLFCLFNGVFVTAMMASDGKALTILMNAWFGHRISILGLPPDPFALLVGNAALCAAWVWRYYIALAAIRWSNY